MSDGQLELRGGGAPSEARPAEFFQENLTAKIAQSRAEATMRSIRSAVDAINGGYFGESHEARSLRDKAAAIWRLSPKFDELNEARRALYDAAFGKAMRRDIVVIVGVLLQARAHFDPVKKAGYIDAMITVLSLEAEMRPFSREALAAGAYRAITEKRFLPEIAELLKLVREEREGFRVATEMLEKVISARVSARGILEDLKIEHDPDVDSEVERQVREMAAVWDGVGALACAAPDQGGDLE